MLQFSAIGQSPVNGAEEEVAKHVQTALRPAPPRRATAGRLTGKSLGPLTGMPVPLRAARRAYGSGFRTGPA
jgi:hypothetical protein